MITSGLTAVQGLGVFVGIPVVILILIALPLYGGRWWRRLTRRQGDPPDTSAPLSPKPGEDESVQRVRPSPQDERRPSS